MAPKYKNGIRPSTESLKKGFVAQAKGKSAEAVRAMSALLERSKFFGTMGQSFGGDRKLYEVFGYKTNITSADLYAKYLRQDIAGTIVNAPADALWTNPPVIKADDAFMAAWTLLSELFSVWDILNRADKMTGWGRFSIIVIGTKDGSNLESPVKSSDGSVGDPTNIIYMQPYSELGVKVAKLDDNAMSPRFGLPLLYQISIGESSVDTTNKGSAVMAKEMKVHYSRIVHIVDGVIEDNVYGRPRLLNVYNLLEDTLKVAGGTAEVYWLTANRGMQIDIDKDMTLGPEDAANLEDEVEEYFHNLRRVIRTRGVKINELGAKVADPSNTFECIMSLISGATRIPKRIFLGSEAGQLASEQDRANWAERVVERRKNFANPHVLVPFITTMVNLGALPKPKGLEIIWPEAFILAPLERAQTSAQKARSATNLAKTLTEQPNLMTVDEARLIIGFGDNTELLEGTQAPNPIAINTRRSVESGS